ncbi:hypothetical protein T01_12975 [Trichinella spiralis]|uniref:Uncharacterized protein n=1 Tax=Trichinella spiralis TaxID=6334 RepID=A0A0V1B6U2_TRISP|nr:hypothetical protein T01_12975 [Trichinella spiralis]
MFANPFTTHCNSIELSWLQTDRWALIIIAVIQYNAVLGVVELVMLKRPVEVLHTERHICIKS